MEFDSIYDKLKAARLLLNEAVAALDELDKQVDAEGPRYFCATCGCSKVEPVKAMTGPVQVQCLECNEIGEPAEGS